jgi:hypothetical protein
LVAITLQGGDLDRGVFQCRRLLIAIAFVEDAG